MVLKDYKIQQLTNQIVKNQTNELTTTDNDSDDDCIEIQRPIENISHGQPQSSVKPITKQQVDEIYQSNFYSTHNNTPPGFWDVGFSQNE